MRNGLFKTFEAQIWALKTTRREILCRIPPHAWSWGGGTVLALYYFNHRFSFDIDIFVRDPQYFSFLSPKWFIDETDAFDSDYSERADHIALKTRDGIKVDLLLSPVLIDASEPDTLLNTGFTFYVDTVREIIAAKLKYRRGDNKARDIFDIAVAMSKYPGLLKEMYDARILGLDEIIEWDEALRKLNLKNYGDEIRLLSPNPEYEKFSDDAPAMVVEAIRVFRQGIWL